MEPGNTLIEKIIRWYIGKNCDVREIQDLDIIVPISYCTTLASLTIASDKILRSSIEFWRKQQTVKIAFCSAGYIFKGAAELEHEYKNTVLSENGVPDDSFLYAGSIKNSIEEAASIKNVLNTRSIEPKNILIITGAMHAPSAKLIWPTIFPNSKISIHCIEYQFEFQKDHPLRAQTTITRWFGANLIRHIALSSLGLKITGHFHHRPRRV